MDGVQCMGVLPGLWRLAGPPAPQLTGSAPLCWPEQQQGAPAGPPDLPPGTHNQYIGLLNDTFILHFPM